MTLHKLNEDGDSATKRRTSPPDRRHPPLAPMTLTERLDTAAITPGADILRRDSSEPPKLHAYCIPLA